MNAQHQTNDDSTSQSAGTRTAPPPPLDLAPDRRTRDAPPRVQVYLNRSATFSTIHGDTIAGDPHHGVAAYQDGLPFNHEDKLIWDHPEVLADENKQKKAERLIARAEKLLQRARSTGAADEEEEDDLDGDDGESGTDVDLGAWARGIADWPWQEISNALARRFSRRVGNKFEAIELLVNEKVVAPGQLSRSYRAMLERGF